MHGRMQIGSTVFVAMFMVHKIRLHMTGKLVCVVYIVSILCLYVVFHFSMLLCFVCAPKVCMFASCGANELFSIASCSSMSFSPHFFPVSVSTACWFFACRHSTDVASIGKCWNKRRCNILCIVFAFFSLFVSCVPVCLATDHTHMNDIFVLHHIVCSSKYNTLQILSANSAFFSSLVRCCYFALWAPLSA